MAIDPLTGALITGGIGAVTQAVSSFFGLKAQDKAAGAAMEAELARLGFDRQVFKRVMKRLDRGEKFDKAELQRIRTELRPFSVQGQNAQNALAYEMGLTNERPWMIDPQAQDQRRGLLENDRQFQRLSDANVFKTGDNLRGKPVFGYGQDSGLEIEKTPGAATQGQPVYNGEGILVGFSEGNPGAPSFNVGEREFDTRAEARGFIDSKNTYDGPQFGSRREATRALEAERVDARERALEGFDGQVRSQYQGYEASPEARLRMEQGRRAIEGTAAARSGLLRGDTANAVLDDTDAVIKANRTNYLNRLQGMGASGMNAITGLPLGGAGSAAATGANALFQGASNVGAGMSNIGQIGAQNAAAQGNIFQNAFQNLGGFAGYGMAQYFNQPQQQPGTSYPGRPF